MATPPPRGVADRCSLRCPGSSWMRRERANTIQLQVRTALATTASTKVVTPCPINPISIARRAVQGLDRSPVLAARALPMVRPGAEAAALAAVAVGPDHQLVGDLLEDPH